MKTSNSLTSWLVLSLLAAILLASCAGPITIDVGGSNGGSGGDRSGNVSSQTSFLLLIVLLVAMFAMILVAVSR